MRHMPTVIKKTPEGRDVIRFRFEDNEETPAMRKPQLTREARALVVEALGLGDSGQLVVGELAEDFFDCPSGSACARFLGSEGTVLHVVGPMNATDPGDVDEASDVLDRHGVIELGTGPGDAQRAALLTREVEELRERNDSAALEIERRQGEVAALSQKLTTAQLDLRDANSRTDAANARADEAQRERDALRNIAKSSAKKSSARGAKK